MDKYEHYVKEVPLDERFPNDYNLVLVKSLSELEEIFESNKSSYMSMDTETSSLNPEEGFLVGFSFSFDGESAYYVPVCHAFGGLGKEALDLFWQRMIQSKRVFMYNARFDMRFMEFAGYSMSEVKYQDVMLSVVLADTNWKQCGLKWAERHFLGWEAETFEQVLGKNPNFYYLDPASCYRYAAVDALGTFKLAQVTMKYFKEGGLSARIENEVLYPIMKYEDTSIKIDRSLIVKYEEDLTNQINSIKDSIYSEVGYIFEINSNKQKSDALRSLGIYTAKTTKTGNMQVSAQALTDLIDSYVRVGQTPPEILQNLITYSKLVKLRSSYVESLLQATQSPDKSLRFSYKVGRVPCLTANNYVIIRSKGRVSIADVSVGDYIWTRFGWKKVLWNNSHLSDNVWALESSIGTIEGTGEHPVLISRDIKENQKDSVLEFVQIQDTQEYFDKYYHFYPSFVKSVPLDLADSVGHGWNYKLDFDLDQLSDQQYFSLIRLLGYFSFAFYRLKDGKFILSSKQEEAGFYVDNFRYIFPNIPIRFIYAQRGRVRLEIEDNPIVRHLFAIAQDKSFISALGYPEIYWFFVGLFDRVAISLRRNSTLLGSSPTPSYAISLTTVRSLEFCEFIHDLLRDYFAISSRAYTIRNYHDSKANQLVILRGESIIYFIDYFAPCLVNKEILNTLMQGLSVSKVQRGIKLIDVRKLEGVHTVYDIEVEDVHEYCVNGMVTHNTGRLACGTDRGNSYFAPINLQSMPKPHSMQWHYRKAVPESNHEFIILGWEFSPAPFEKGDLGVVEGKELTNNLRRAFGAGEGRYWVCIDYNAQELRIPANLSGDESFIKSFESGGDPHEDTAIQMFGENNYNKDKRKIAKTFNFGILYGMNSRSVAERYKVSLDVAEDWVASYRRVHQGLFSWMDHQVALARRKGTVYNYFGRPRRVGYYLSSSDSRIRAFGERTVSNTLVQSVGADLTKLALIRYWDSIFNNDKFKETLSDGSVRSKVDFAATIHDEIDFIVDKDIAEQVISLAIRIQRIKVKGWTLPMDVGLEIGTSWGVSFPFEINQETGEILHPSTVEVDDTDSLDKLTEEITEFEF